MLHLPEESTVKTDLNQNLDWFSLYYLNLIKQQEASNFLKTSVSVYN